jgi:hypothetical protein
MSTSHTVKWRVRLCDAATSVVLFAVLVLPSAVGIAALCGFLPIDRVPWILAAITVVFAAVGLLLRWLGRGGRVRRGTSRPERQAREPRREDGLQPPPHPMPHR